MKNLAAAVTFSALSVIPAAAFAATWKPPVWQAAIPDGPAFFGQRIEQLTNEINANPAKLATLARSKPDKAKCAALIDQADDLFFSLKNSIDYEDRVRFDPAVKPGPEGRMPMFTTRHLEHMTMTVARFNDVVATICPHHAETIFPVVQIKGIRTGTGPLQTRIEYK